MEGTARAPDLPQAARTRLPICERVEAQRREEGRPRVHLHAHDPELVVAVLACARIGAVHSVVFAGFSAQSIADRIQDAQAAFVLTSDGMHRGAKQMPVKRGGGRAIAALPCDASS